MKINQLIEMPIEPTGDPNDPTVYGHERANPMSLKGRIVQARNQLKELADLAESDELVVWEKITRLSKGGMFMGLEQNLEQIRHGIEQLAAKRRQGGVASRGIDRNIGEAKGPAQQAAIAIAMKKAGKKPKGVAEGLFGIDDKIKGRIQNVVSDLSDIPGMWDHKAQTFTDAGMDKLKTVLKNNPKYIKYALNLNYRDYEAEGVAEGWSKKYKSSINCSHPRGFSQKAHCAGKRKHNESVDMEMVCEDCGMCQTHGSLNEIAKGAKDSNGFTKCWPGKHAEGTKKGKNGGQVRNCVPNESQGVAEGHADQQRKIFKKNGKPVGEVGIDRESSPGNGQWYMKCYAYDIDNSGYDSYEEAVEELKHCLKQGVAEGKK